MDCGSEAFTDETAQPLPVPLKPGALQIFFLFTELEFFRRNSFVVKIDISWSRRHRRRRRRRCSNSSSSTQLHICLGSSSLVGTTSVAFLPFSLKTSFFLFSALQSSRSGPELESRFGSRWASLAWRIFPTHCRVRVGRVRGFARQRLGQFSHARQLSHASAADERLPFESPPELAVQRVPRRRHEVERHVR